MKRRLITAIIILVIMVPLLYLGGWWTVGAATFACVGGVLEILKTGKGKKWNPLVYVFTIIGTLVILFWWFIICYIDGTAEIFSIPNPYVIRVNVIAIAAFLMALLSVEVSTKNFNMPDVFYIFTMVFLISIAGQGVIFVREELGLRFLGFIVFCTYCCDTFAYLTGRFFGKHKFAPVISPKKTWEGTIGGIVATTLLGVAYYYIFPFTTENVWLVPIMAAILGVGAVCGDLIFSSIKRQVHIKDFGNLLPGHGGILDRIDSLLFNVIVFISVYGFITMGVFN